MEQAWTYRKNCFSRVCAKPGREGQDIEFVRGDTRNLQYNTEFDSVLILCEGGFSLMETDEMDRKILSGAARALCPGGRQFLTAPIAASRIYIYRKAPIFSFLEYIL
ncbi:MAG: hypothetical protein GWN61_17480 [candidate division Zixibacteria bacterium]|nr:class I SAM-dependent methyltransferase [candidate division Zixibacteria bacterium]NIS47662.1 class I SAM-dependent methyltransferase [candidate division Zixibacteria bacterium]NIU15766.1 class I SAM-dependent methyltransferase [candidate division Zixibacteria bacterium]NIV07913.1 hypothetical protein [candidate division Zixibacteria bacterium]